MKRSLLAVLAHPDDESYGMGGTLARYAHEGVDVHVAIATDGAAGSIDENWQGDRSRLAEARSEELRRATEVLGAKLHQLNYRDSGYIGDPANDHPDAFINADKDGAVGRIVKLIRQIHPQVVVTHDETGGYLHPDHIRCNVITTAAFFAAGSTEKYPANGMEPYQPQRLYYSAFPKKWVSYVILFRRLRGLNPTKAGRNQDIDLTKIGIGDEKITTIINYRKYWDVKQLASMEHVSQGGGTTMSRLIPTLFQKWILAQESYIRVYPPFEGDKKEKDFFSNGAGMEDAETN